MNLLCLPYKFKYLQVIDMLIFKGMEELENIVEHSKQRHHMIGQYVVGHHGLVQEMGTKEQGLSPFLKNFYKSNYLWTILVVARRGTFQ